MKHGDDTVIHLRGVYKDYSLESRPLRRLWEQMLHRRPSGAVHHALQPLDLVVRKGESIGVIGRNGAGKSTLLQLLCGVLDPTGGSREVRGRIAALLELGAGFNLDLTGRENVRLNGALLGLSAADIEQHLPRIVDFADIGTFIDQPVRRYSSGMFVRLAFSMATSVDPDILVIDEALSVGDGAFARKSFDRIMSLRDAGKTIFFCSHAMHPIESICSRVLWLEDGKLQMAASPADAVAAYNNFLASREAETFPGAAPVKQHAAPARISSYAVSVDGQVARVLALQSAVSDLSVSIDFEADPGLPTPTVAVGIVARNGSVVASAGSHNDGMLFSVSAEGRGRACLLFPRLPLLKGEYFLRLFLMCERGIHIYEHVDQVAEIVVSQHGLEQGYVRLPHEWPGATRVSG